MGRAAWRSLLVVFVGWPSLGPAADFKAPAAKIELAAGDTLVFLGDSITHQCLYTQYAEDYFYTRYPDRRIHFHNAGVGGDRCADALLRFDADVARFKPKYVTVLLGMNDGTYQPFQQAVFDTYERDMHTLIDRIQAAGATPVLMTPTMYDARAARMSKRPQDERRNRYYNATLGYYGALLREVSAERGLGFVDMYSPLNNLSITQRRREPSFTLICDAVHPDAPGQAVMAAALLDDMHPNRLVSSIQVTIDSTGYAKASAEGGKIIGIESDGQTLAFSFRASALPWVLPPDAALGYRLVQAGYRLSREQLRVVGLEPGKYLLTIDRAAAGSYSHVDLAAGIELAENSATGQYQQALAVAMLNKQRNEKAIRPLRDLWVAKKMQRFTADQVKKNPTDQKAVDRLAQLDMQLADFERKAKTLEAEAEKFEEQIYQTNQPKEHRYELVRKG